MGEYFGRYNLTVNTPFIAMGTTDDITRRTGARPGSGAEPMAFSILR